MADQPHTTPTPAPRVPPTASIDAELLALAAEFQTVDARLMAINDEIMADTTDTRSMDKGEPAAVHGRWWQIVDRVIELPAHTQAGWAAKAAIIPAVIRDVADSGAGTPDINIALSLVRDLTGQAGPGPDAELLTACEAFHRIHAEMKDPKRGDTDADDEALGVVAGRWYDALDAAVAIPARTAAGQQAKLQTVYTALSDAMKDEPLFGNREEFAALAFLTELLGDTATSPQAEARLSPAAPTDAPAAQDDIESLLAASEVADKALFDMETLFFDMHAEIDVIGHVATSDREVSPAVWHRIENHRDLALATLEDTWTLAQERRHALRDAVKAEQRAFKLLRMMRIEKAAPGGIEDIERADAMWTMLRTMARLALEYCDKARPAACTPTERT
jgi:hypothetical protein